VWDLVVLPGLPLDVILGMSWMKRWKAVLDTTSRTLSFTDPQDGGRFQVLLPQSANLASISCATQVIELSKIPIVCDFSDVFLMNYLVFHAIEMLSLRLSWYLELHQFPKGLIGCHQMS
jgi:hypothetical protein